MIDEAALPEALDEIRALVRADGGELLLTSVEGGTVRLQLVLEDAGCAECVMPRSFLERVASDMIAARVRGATGVSIDDPREQPDAPPSA